MLLNAVTTIASRVEIFRHVKQLKRRKNHSLPAYEILDYQNNYTLAINIQLHICLQFFFFES